MAVLPRAGARGSPAAHAVVLLCGRIALTVFIIGRKALVSARCAAGIKARKGRDRPKAGLGVREPDGRHCDRAARTRQGQATSIQYLRKQRPSVVVLVFGACPSLMHQGRRSGGGVIPPRLCRAGLTRKAARRWHDARAIGAEGPHNPRAGFWWVSEHTAKVCWMLWASLRAL